MARVHADVVHFYGEVELDEAGDEIIEAILLMHADALRALVDPESVPASRDPGTTLAAEVAGPAAAKVESAAERLSDHLEVGIERTYVEVQDRYASNRTVTIVAVPLGLLAAVGITVLITKQVTGRLRDANVQLDASSEEIAENIVTVAHAAGDTAEGATRTQDSAGHLRAAADVLRTLVAGATDEGARGPSRPSDGDGASAGQVEPTTRYVAYSVGEQVSATNGHRHT